MSEKRYGLIGQKLGHSFSPAIHRRLGNYDYQLFELEPEELGPFLTKGDFAGLNVTLPYKTAVIPYCKELTPKARRIGSVNTILKMPDGSLLGDNTDYEGFVYMLKTAGAQVKGKKALVLGTGGASLTVHAVLRDLGIGEAVSISRKGPNHYGNLELHRDAQLIINATPVGMYPDIDASPVDLDQFPCVEGVFDLIYNPECTKLLLQAVAKGVLCSNGLGMLVAQAKAAAELFTGHPIPDQRVEEIIMELVKESRNLMLIGMPGCGKTTVGQALAKRLGRELVDTDSVVEATAGCTIPELFAQRGEEAFRQLEHQVLKQTAARSGLVIATGGGVVTREENLAPMAQNSTVIFLRRDLDQLPTNGRPISQRSDMKELYRHRLPLYRRAADIDVENCTVEEAVDEIIRRLKLS